jgi:hypothetical protein
MVIEIEVPEEWSPALGFTLAQLLRETFARGLPVVVAARPDLTAEELCEAFVKARAALADAGLATQHEVGQGRLADVIPIAGN